ncbi:MAG: acyltransferase family protein [Actinomycetes bacterium]
MLLLDLLRTVALYRVVTLHVTGIDPLTWIAAMPVMFFVAGSLVAASLRRRPGRTVVVDRFRRILLPLGVYAAALVVLYASQGLLTSSLLSTVGPGGWIAQLGVYDTARLFVPVLSLGAPVGPGAPSDPVFWTWDPLWYLHAHLVFVLVAPLLFALFRRRRSVLFGVVGLVWLVDAVVNRGTFNLFTFLLFFVAGFAFDDGTLGAVPRRRLGLVGLAAGVVGLALVPAGPGLSVNGWVPSLLLLGVAWLAAAIWFRDPLERLARTRLVRPVVEFTNRRALTVYLWSLLGVYVSRLLLPPPGRSFGGKALVALESLTLTAVVTLVACLAVGWVEDVAARRRPELWPTWDPAPDRALPTGPAPG